MATPMAPGSMPHPGAYHQPVPQGPRAYRQRIRAVGPLLALVPATLIGTAALLLLRGNTSTIRGVVGFAAAVLAAPGLLVGGVPLTAGTTVYAAAIGGSAVMWFGLGALAARRATSRSVCSWRDFWRELAWLACGVWLGVIGALLAANLVMGRALF